MEGMEIYRMEIKLYELHRKHRKHRRFHSISTCRGGVESAMFSVFPMSNNGILGINKDLSNNKVLYKDLSNNKVLYKDLSNNKSLYSQTINFYCQSNPNQTVKVIKDKLQNKTCSKLTNKVLKYGFIALKVDKCVNFGGIGVLYKYLKNMKAPDDIKGSISSIINRKQKIHWLVVGKTNKGITILPTTNKVYYKSYCGRRELYFQPNHNRIYNNKRLAGFEFYGVVIFPASLIVFENKDRPVEGNEITVSPSTGLYNVNTLGGLKWIG